MKIVKNDLFDYKNRYIYQADDGFKFSLDSILLAEYVNFKKNQIILDMCTGNAAIPLVISTKTDNKIIAFEIQKEIATLAKKSVELNKLEKQIEIKNDDINNIDKYFNKEYFDIIICNPPYFKVNDKNYFNESVEKTIARHEVKISLEEVVMVASKLLKNNGTFAMVHRTERLLEIFDLFRKYHIEPKRVRFVYEFVHKPSTLVLIEGIKHGKLGLKVEAPFIMKMDDGSYSSEYERFLVEVKSSETE